MKIYKNMIENLIIVAEYILYAAVLRDINWNLFSTPLVGNGFMHMSFILLLLCVELCIIVYLLDDGFRKKMIIKNCIILCLLFLVNYGCFLLKIKGYTDYNNTIQETYEAKKMCNKDVVLHSVRANETCRCVDSYIARLYQKNYASLDIPGMDCGYEKVIQSALDICKEEWLKKRPLNGYGDVCYQIYAGNIAADELAKKNQEQVDEINRELNK